jgi:hypothetical protein
MSVNTAPIKGHDWFCSIQRLPGMFLRGSTSCQGVALFGTEPFCYWELLPPQLNYRLSVSQWTPTISLPDRPKQLTINLFTCWKISRQIMVPNTAAAQFAGSKRTFREVFSCYIMKKLKHSYDTWWRSKIVNLASHLSAGCKAPWRSWNQAHDWLIRMRKLFCCWRIWYQCLYCVFLHYNCTTVLRSMNNQ